MIFFSFTCVLVLGFMAGAITEPLPGAENVCHKTVKLDVNQSAIRSSEYQPKHTIQLLCNQGSCKKIQVQLKMDRNLTQYNPIDQQIRTCCPGYVESAEGKCEPLCEPACRQGNCIKPNVCKCHVEPSISLPGYIGDTCDKLVCLDNKWGLLCDQECNCPADLHCNVRNGECLDQPSLMRNASLNLLHQLKRRMPPDPSLQVLKESVDKLSKDLDSYIVAQIALCLIFIVCWFVQSLIKLIFNFFTADRQDNRNHFNTKPTSNSTGNSNFTSGPPTNLPTSNQTPSLQRTPMPKSTIPRKSANKTCMNKKTRFNQSTKNISLNHGEAVEVSAPALLRPMDETSLTSSRKNFEESPYLDVESIFPKKICHKEGCRDSSKIVRFPEPPLQLISDRS